MAALFPTTEAWQQPQCVPMKKQNVIYIYTFKHTHTHTHIYIPVVWYIYLYACGYKIVSYSIKRKENPAICNNMDGIKVSQRKINTICSPLPVEVGK